MVTCGRQTFNMLPMAPLSPFVVGLTPAAVAAVAVAGGAVPPSSSSSINITTTAAATTMANNNTTMTSSKPKLAFSIDSIVGSREKEQLSSTSTNTTPPNKQKQRCIERHNQQSMACTSPKDASYSQHQTQLQPLELRTSAAPDTPSLSYAAPTRGLIYCRRRSSLDHSPPPSSPVSRSRSRSRSPLPTESHTSQRSRSRTPDATPPCSPQTPSTQSATGAPLGHILMPSLPHGLIRPLPLQAPNNLALIGARPTSSEQAAISPSSQPSAGQTTNPHAQASHVVAPALTATLPPGGAAALAHPPPPSFLAAQFQMAAALAHHHQQPPPPHLPPGHPMSLFPHGPAHHPHFASAPHLIRDSYPLYPWLLSRHGRIFPRFPGNFLLQPFRKPKRVRTAFSPTQLLKLEHAFEGNHYVVGAERKQLAQGLSLTETQVKVWFQNRRTKHKRMQQEGGESDTKSNKGSCSGRGDDGRNDNSQHSSDDEDHLDEEDEVEDDEENEVIDMDDYGSDIDAEEQQRMREQFQQQLQQHQQHFQQQLQTMSNANGAAAISLSAQQQQQLLQHHHHQQQQQQQQHQQQQQQQQLMQQHLYMQQQTQQQQQQQQKQP